MDKTDFAIVSRLVQDARMPFRRIAKELGVSTDTVTRRYSALKKQGVIFGATVTIDPKVIGFQGLAVFLIDISPFCSLKKDSVRYDSLSVLKELAKMPNVFQPTRTVGDHDLLCFAAIKDLDHLIRIRNDIAAIPSVRDIQGTCWTEFLEFPNLQGHHRLFLRSDPTVDI
ncbi:MAG: Lrp/AsnC family transcriptional regulator [Candidatus Atabeyarchaeum deiterrae]